MGQHLRAVEASPFGNLLQSGGVDTEELEIPQIPEGYELLLSVFWRLRNNAADKGITHQELLAWQQLYRAELLPDEIDLIFTLDHAARIALSEQD